jgi:hypothetical protein
MIPALTVIAGNGVTTLKIDDSAMARWLDEIQLYHFPLRDYASGLAAFLQTDPVPAEDSLYAAFGANPANFGDDSGAMQQSNQDPQGRLDLLLSELLQNPRGEFSVEDRQLLRSRLLEVQGAQADLVSRGQRFVFMLSGIERAVNITTEEMAAQMDRELEATRILLLSRTFGGGKLGKLYYMERQEKQRHMDMFRVIAEWMVEQRVSVKRRMLSDQFIRLNYNSAITRRSLQNLQLEWQDNESWLDIYQHPIENMWMPGQENSDEEDDDDDDEDVEVRSHDSPIEESDEDPEPIVARGAVNDMNSEQRRSGRGPHEPDDEKIE